MKRCVGVGVAALAIGVGCSNSSGSAAPPVGASPDAGSGSAGAPPGTPGPGSPRPAPPPTGIPTPPTEGNPPLDAGLLLPPPGDAGGPHDLVLRGVCWNPVGVGQVHPEGLDYAGFAALDIPLLQALGVNVVRTYEPLLDRAVLDQLYAAGIRVIESIYPWGGVEASVVTERVLAIADHPAVLFYALGNEWNYNGLYVGLSFEDSLARLNEAARLVREADPSRPIATIYGELPAPETIAAMPDIDVWGINAYRGIGFGDLFDAWSARSDKAMFIAEYGADAYNANLPAYDPESQALAVAALTREILERATGGAPGARVLGGTIFEFADEWWKDTAGSASEQDVGGVAPGGGPYPDQVFNEEWWGIVDVARTPRPAYDALRGVFAEFP